MSTEYFDRDRAMAYVNWQDHLYECKKCDVKNQIPCEVGKPLLDKLIAAFDQAREREA